MARTPREDVQAQPSLVVASLGEAVVRLWGELPRDVQQSLFERAVSAHGERMRSPLAVFLHQRHPRTADSREWM